MTDKWDLKFLALAQAVATIFSKDPSTRVGAVAVGERPNLVAFGFNGLPPGLADDDRLNDRAWKNAHVIHAEENALANAIFPVARLYVTHPPCARCAVRILAYRTIKEVVTLVPDGDFLDRWKASTAAAEAIFKEAGVVFRLVV